MAQHTRHALPVLRRHCDDCRHDRTTYHAGDFTTPPDCDPGCAVLDGDEPAPGDEALRRYTRGEGRAFDHVLEHGGCPAWQGWKPCAQHGLPAHPQHGCAECVRESNQAEVDCA